ncbi:hypothetical protein AYL99_05423 [Fonsecaea erecta]|uniref:Uncharacterized protein n=1 Tax=Fonsecaea erecta TaxID=1367422 RepID=A0A178ZLQ3_9EURO|nr:hypothetical protein AYL99_05423 [Fonsecaea erecta]OAP60421.1 hypothetical protein AYL99_05423 [Fonsecaea erecta]
MPTSSQGVENQTTAARPTDGRDAINEQSTLEPLSRSGSVAKQKHEAILELELKLFKNMTIRIVPQATPLRPMLRPGEVLPPDHIAANAPGGRSVNTLAKSFRALRFGRRYPLPVQNTISVCPGPPSQDDMFVDCEPIGYIDYLSHPWDTGDVMLSWRFVSQRKSAVHNSQRLENSACRCWTKLPRDTSLILSPAVELEKKVRCHFDLRGIPITIIAVETCRRDYQDRAGGFELRTTNPAGAFHYNINTSSEPQGVSHAHASSRKLFTNAF